jgi:acetyltransferase-like isoleucine patch superfamily enzyme
MVSRIIYKVFIRVKNYLALWYKKQNLLSIHKQANKNSIGQKFRIGQNVRISGLNNASIGNNVYIGSGAFIRAEGGLTLGSNVIFSRNIVLYTISHNYEGEYLPYDSTTIKRPVVIEDNVWIGMNVTIAPGSYIGEGSIIGIGARIYGNIPKYSIVGSNGKVINERNKEHYHRLTSYEMFADDDGHKVVYE